MGGSRAMVVGPGEDVNCELIEGVEWGVKEKSEERFRRAETRE